MNKSVQNFVQKIAQRETTDLVNNFYASIAFQANLTLYLDYLLVNKPLFALVGEAPGYKGCAQTGIPFTSQRVLNQGSNIFFTENRDHIFSNGDFSENTATIVWKAIGDINVPLLWNIFPFHPHQAGNINSNRKPTRHEAYEGIELCLDLLSIIEPKYVIAVGKVAETTLKKYSVSSGTELLSVRHPSFGGATKFSEGYKKIVNQVIGGDK